MYTSNMTLHIRSKKKSNHRDKQPIVPTHTVPFRQKLTSETSESDKMDRFGSSKLT